MPKRIQRKRAKGWRMPESVVYVGRPTKWGNPFRPQTIADDPQSILARYAAHILLRSDLDVSELRGKDLACWCKEGSPCHADVLLELANE